MRRSGLLLPLFAAVVITPDARAATVTASVVEGGTYPREYSYVAIRVTDADGAANRFSLVSDDRTIEVRDRGAPLSAGSGCAAGSDGAVRCAKPRSMTAEVTVVAGDGDDVVDASGLAASKVIRAEIDGGAGADQMVGGQWDDRLDGGAGDDRLDGGDAIAYPSGGDLFIGGPGDDQVVGGPGYDRIHGGPGADNLEGGGGGDTLTPDEAGVDSDRVNGGKGFDSVSYQDRKDPVRVNLADPAPDGGAGERDILREIEGVTGGTAADRLIGDEGPNILEGSGNDTTAGDRLEGRGGNDELRGRRGNDVLLGGPGDDRLNGDTGRDRLDGGGGNDSLDADSFSATPPDPRAAPPVVRCGRGSDLLSGPPPSTLIPRDCERFVVIAVDTQLVSVDRSRRRLRFRLLGRSGRTAGPCHLRIAAGRSPVVVGPSGDRPQRVAVGYRRRRGGVAMVRFDYRNVCRPGAPYRLSLTLRFPLD